MDFFEKFTKDAKKVMAYSNKSAIELRHDYIGSEHLLLGLTLVESNISKMLASKGVTYQNVYQCILEIVGEGQYTNASRDYTPRTKKILQSCYAIANEQGYDYVEPEQIFRAILCETTCLAISILEELGVDLLSLNMGFNDISSDAQGSMSQNKMLDTYGIDLTSSAKNEKLDPVIGRDNEIERVVQILSRRTKNNPVLIGEPGVGKSAIAEGLAQKLYKGDVPSILQGKKLYLLDMARMVAGAKYRGEFEERLKETLKEVEENKNIILFIDEIHTLISTGATEGGMDAANILKPSLARGEIQLIGATTLKEYKKYVEKDSALERRFAPVMIGEPSEDEAIQILKGLRDKYEAHHGVKITDEAIMSSVKLSKRYIADRFLPDKAIDLMDEAASKVKIDSCITPDEIKKLNENLQSIGVEKKAAINNQDFERAASLRDEEKEIKEKIEVVNKQKKSSDNQLTVDKKDIENVVAQWTKIPVEEIGMDESKRLLNLEQELEKSVIGQNEAIKSVSKAIRRARAGLKDPNRPIGSFVFLGSTGIGKTELTKALAKTMFGDESAMIRVDMSEYMEKHSVAKLIGSPPGYVGFEDGGQLTETVRRKPYSVILFDEIEKAHPDVFNILLQILDDGRLTDSHGKTVDFKNTIIIMTSNVGASNFNTKSLGFGTKDEKQEYDDEKKRMIDSLKKEFRPEFINRIDDIIVFHKLTQEDIRKIVDILVGKVADMLSERQVVIEVSDEAKDYLAKIGYDNIYGARPLKRKIQQKIEDNLSEMILDGSLKFGQKVFIGCKDDELIFDVK